MHLQYHPELSFAFPTSRCCNCGGKTALSVKPQDTKLTRYIGIGGTEVTLSLPLCVCARCAPTLRRRPPTWFTRVLTWLALGAALFLAAVTLGEPMLSGLGAWFNGNLFPISLAVSAAVMGLAIRLRQPGHDQSSFFQPVRLLDVNRRFNSPYIEGVALSFSNAAYLRDFVQLNAEGLKAGYIQAHQAR